MPENAERLAPAVADAMERLLMIPSCGSVFGNGLAAASAMMNTNYYFAPFLPGREDKAAQTVSGNYVQINTSGAFMNASDGRSTVGNFGSTAAFGAFILLHELGTPLSPRAPSKPTDELST